MPRDTHAQASVSIPEPALALWLVEQAAARGALLHVAVDEGRLGRLSAAAEAFAGRDVEVLTLPPWDTLPYDRSPPSPTVVGRRVRTLEALSRPAERPRLVLTTADAALQRVPPQTTWANSAMWLETGRPLDLDALRVGLAERGYQLEERVDEPGEVAIHGQTIDVFAAGDPCPVRLTVGADGRIASIATYDAATQRSTGAVDRVALHRAVEFPPEPEEVEHAAEALAGREPVQDPDKGGTAVVTLPSRLVPLFDYLPNVAAVFDPEVDERWQAFAEQVEDAYSASVKARRARSEGSTLPRPSRLYMTPAAAASTLAGRLLGAAPDGAAIEAPRSVGALVATARHAAVRGDRVVIATPTDPAPLAASLARRGLDVRVAEAWGDAVPGEVSVLRMDVAEGLIRPGLLLLPVAALLRTRGSTRFAQIDETSCIGDLVVHLQHGVARLSGLREVAEENQPAERVALEFADGAQLLVPMSELDQVWRYGTDSGDVPLDRIGGDAWHRKRLEIEAEIAETAHALAAAAAARAARHAPVIKPSPEARTVARRFAYPLSPDQRAAIDSVLADLATGRPMNRLVCGDVGFGKTEIALRAIAATALAGWQVALVAPTGVLARQHLDTVSRRLAGTGIRVESVRATTSPAGRRVLRGLASGDVGVVVGTRAIASDAVQFRRLGLVVIDEEQRFGEADKARLARLGTEGPTDDVNAAHTLVMTATPIPRTLQRALVGLRDVSVIATPPVSRQPTRSFVLPWDPVVAREALIREHRRGGQSFVVVPRITDLHPMAARLAAVVPEFHVVQAHGRLRAEELEAAVVGFAAGDGDMLLATNIIEAGLDIPRANTILVLGAGRFGLAQLHQLRGRVGRGRRRGSAYFMTEAGHRLAPAARRRLQMLETLSGLGAGVAISSADLDLRGAGDLFGERQAGHVRAIGTPLYQHLLARAVAELRGETLSQPPPELRVGLSGRIPAEYVREPNLRLELYARIARLTDPAELADFEEELADRFGPPPPELTVSMLARLRCRCARLGISRLDAGPEGAALTPRDPDEADKLADALHGRLKDGRVLLQAGHPAALSRVKLLLQILD